MAAVYPINICNSLIEIFKMLTRNFVLVPYDTKFWRENILANSGNCKRFAKIFVKNFLPKSRNIQCIAS